MDDLRRVTTVQELAAKSGYSLATGPFGSSISSKFFVDSGIPVIRGSNLSESLSERLVEEGLVFITLDKAEGFERSKAKRGDLIFTCWGTIGQVGLVDNRAKYDEYVVSNKQMKFTPDPDQADSLYMYYLFSSPEMSNRIKNQAIGSSVPGFNLGQLKSLRVNIPPLDIQKRIASILGAFDDKIELNRKMNATLEAMAQALFKSWFVDFDPVKAKAEGREVKGLSGEIADLFPSRLVPSELGLIPDGWDVGSISTFCSKVENGGTPSRKVPSYWLPATVPWLTSGEVRQNLIVSVDNAISEEGLVNSSAKIWEPESTIVALYGATAGQVSMLRVRACGNQACCCLSPKSGQANFLNFALRRSEGALNAMARGSAQQNLSKGIVESTKSVLPANDLSKIFNELVEPFVKSMDLNLRQSARLGEIRDVLLPKLISGEIRVPEAERIASDAL